MLKYIVLVVVLAFVKSQILDPRCPPGTPNPPLHLNDPANCSRFFTCVNGVAMPTDCPPGQHWSISANACDWPERANCVAGNNTCPPNNPVWPEEPRKFPHPTDCTRFFKCNWGVPMEMQCPPGQHWSVVHGWCDWPDRANCQLGTTSTTRASNTTTVTTRSTTTRSTTTQSTTTRRSSG